MIEFTLNRNRNGKKSRWAKKYPRKRILKKGSEKAAGWYPHNWYDDDYHYFHGDMKGKLEKSALCQFLLLPLKLNGKIGGHLIMYF